MPYWKNLQKFVTFVEEYNTKDRDSEDATFTNLIDPNYTDAKAVVEEFGLRKFKEKVRLNDAEVAQIYKSALHMKFVEQRIRGENSTHAQGTAIVVTDLGREFIHTNRIGLRTGKWHAIVKYYTPWTITIALGSLVVSFIALIASIKK